MCRPAAWMGRCLTSVRPDILFVREAPGDSPGPLGYIPGVPARVGKFPETAQGFLDWARGLLDQVRKLPGPLPDTDPAIWREHEEIVLVGGVPPHDMDILAVACPRMIWTFYFQAVACPRMIWIFYFQAAACPRTV